MQLLDSVVSRLFDFISAFFLRYLVLFIFHFIWLPFHIFLFDLIILFRPPNWNQVGIFWVLDVTDPVAFSFFKTREDGGIDLCVGLKLTELLAKLLGQVKNQKGVATSTYPQFFNLSGRLSRNRKELFQSYSIIQDGVA